MILWFCLEYRLTLNLDNICKELQWILTWIKFFGDCGDCLNCKVSAKSSNEAGVSYFRGMAQVETFEEGIHISSYEEGIRNMRCLFAISIMSFNENFVSYSWFIDVTSKRVGGSGLVRDTCRFSKTCTAIMPFMESASIDILRLSVLLKYDAFKVHVSFWNFRGLVMVIDVNNDR